MAEEKYFSEFDSYLFHNGTDYEVYRKLGAHIVNINGTGGTLFCVWAPNARSVSVVTSYAWWDEDAGKMEKQDGGIWTKFMPGIGKYASYRYIVEGADGVKRSKSDPCAFYSELRPSNASIVYTPESYSWQDGEYMSALSPETACEKPMAIYEVHLGSWKKDYRRGENGFLSYGQLAGELAEYLNYMGYTHVELIGICEHPFDGSWGYQATGFFSPTSRYGEPDDFKYFVDTMHRHGIGVILDFVPAHFPKDEFALGRFDGTPLYESADPLRAEYPEWGTYAFDHSKPEVRSFLISSAIYWIKEFHIDALRVDAVASMLYSSFGRSEYRPNIYGGTENLESTEFLKQLNSAVKKYTGAFVIAEDSSMVNGVTEDMEKGGLGFSFKWNMGWMNDTLKYVETDPVFRRYAHEKLTHTADYAFLENWVLVLSHDEVVHLKRSMLDKFPGSFEDKSGGLKTLYTFQFTHPGKKLLFMGQDIAEDREWNEAGEVNWSLASDAGHRDVMLCVRKLLGIYKTHSVLCCDSKNSATFEWINRYDADRNIISFIRRNPWNYEGAVLVVCSFSPVFHTDYSCGVPVAGSFKRIFSTYDFLPGETGESAEPELLSSEQECDGHGHMLTYSLRPYESIILEFPDNV